jgi:hypothetical protein
MSTRLIWISLAIVAAVLIGVSRLASPTAWQELWAPIAAYPWQGWYLHNLAEARALVMAHPERTAALGAAGLLLPVGWVVRRVRRRRRLADVTTPFAELLDDAVAGHVEPVADSGERPRKRLVAELALAGHPVAEISRSTRLSQDAVRALLARGT